MSSVRTSSRFVVASALIALWLGLPLVSLLHASHAHRYCAEHETYEELAQSGALEAELSCRDSLRRGEPAESADADAHQSCALFAARTKDVPPETADVDFPPRAVPAPHLATADELIPRAIAILATAPKQSPPGA